jgi:DNA-binding MarR family transcriptional regulator
LAAEPAAIPASALTLDVLVEQTEELEAAQKYALRAMLDGVDTIEDLQLFLGLDDADVGRAIAGLLVAEYIDYRPPPQGTVRRLTLLDTGREAARDAQLRRPAPATIPVVYDRLAKAVTPRSIGARPPSVSSCVMWSSHQAGRVLVENAAEL